MTTHEDTSKASLRVIIFGNGAYSDPTYYKKELAEKDYIIAVDGGGNFTYEQGIEPHLVMGDMDSITCEAHSYYQGSGVSIEEFPAEKDESDLELAIKRSQSLNPGEIHIFGALGKRLDHTIANLMVLRQPSQKGLTVWLKDEQHEITVISSNSTLVITGMPGDYLSLFPLTSVVEGVFTEGVKYRLHGESLYMGPSRGLSNEFISSQVDISVASGELLMIKTRRF